MTTLEAALLNKAETAKLIRCSIRHLEHMTNKGLMPVPVRLGTAPRYRRAELMQWIADGCQPVREVSAN
jgi:predicted DNA-binding transcriptional regulator AlpA